MSIDKKHITKLINENWELQKRFLDKDMVQQYDDKRNELTRLRRQYYDLEDEILRKGRELKSHLLKTKRSTANVNVKAGHIFYIEDMKGFRSATGGIRGMRIKELSGQGWSNKVMSNIKVIKVNPKSVVLEFTLSKTTYGRYIRNADGQRVYQDGGTEISDVRKRMKIEMFKQFYVELMTNKEYMDVMSERYIKKINESNNNNHLKYIRLINEGRWDHNRLVLHWNELKPFLNKDSVKKTDDYGDEVNILYNDISRLEQELEQTKREFNRKQGKWKTLIKQSKRNIGASVKVGQILPISKMNSFNYQIWSLSNSASNWREKDPKWVEIEGLDDYRIQSDIEIIEMKGKMITIRFSASKQLDWSWVDMGIITKKMRLTTFKLIYFNLMTDKYYKEVMENQYLKKINK
tara:strand:- start:98331 stop:99548 length:1218 start_codon:yes stop_codon:yes gene_type:complete